MADELKRVGLVFKADGTVDFKKSLSEVNASIQENRSEFKLAQSQWDDNTKSAEKLADKQQYLASQTKDYKDKVKMLEGELAELEDEENKNAETIKEKQSVLKTIKSAANDYKEKCAALKSEIEDLSEDEETNASAITKKKKELESAEKQYIKYSEKADKAEAALEKLSASEGRNETAIAQKKTKLNQAKTSLNNYEKGLKEVENKLKSGSAELEEYTGKVSAFSEKCKGASDKLSGVSTAAAGILAGAGALVPATEEYRKVMGTLEVSSEKAGYTAEQTKETYISLFEVLGDDQAAATTTANLQALNLSQEQLQQLVSGTIGAWATYGDSIPIDALAESINETIKVGEVTGTFADVLNWAGTSEDDFNAKLATCNSDAERSNLVMQELANQGLMQAGEQWKSNNESIVEGNQATAQMNEATAQLAETIAPVITQITEIVAGLIEKFNGLPPSVQKTIGIGLLLVASLSTVFSIIGSVSSAVTVAIGLFKALWVVMAANPVGLIITAIALLIGLFVTLYNKCEWFREGVNTIFSGIKEFFEGIKEWFIGIFDFEWKLPKIKLPHFSITGEFGIDPPSIPHFSVEWKKTAMRQAHILTNATIFGAMNGNALGAGEAGSEMVVGTDYFKEMIAQASGADNRAIIEELRNGFAMIYALMAQFFPSFINDKIVIGDREFRRLLTDMGVVFN